MTNSEKLARWQGLENVRPTRLSNGTIVIIYNSNEIIPDYLNNDAAAMSLLDTLVEKGFATRVEYDYEQDQWAAVIFKPVAMGADSVLHIWKSSRREAVVSAALEMIGKEDV